MRPLPAHPRLGPSEVHVVVARVEEAAATPTLPSSEPVAPALAARRRLTRVVLARYLDVDAGEVPLIRDAKPVVEGGRVEVSITDSGGWVLVAIAASSVGPVGVDLEVLSRRVASHGLLDRSLSARERAWVDDASDLGGRHRRFLWLWVCKEAVSKAQGRGLPGRMAAVDVLDGRLDRWRLHELAPAPGTVAALAAAGDVELLELRWQP